jgi:hypothetical protein
MAVLSDIQENTLRLSRNIVLGSVLLVFIVLALNQTGLIKLSGTNAPNPVTSSSPNVWCGSALAAIPLANVGPNGNPNYPGCYSQTFTTFKIATTDAVSGAATNALFIRILSGGGPLNTVPLGTPLESGQESGNTYTATAGPYTTGQSLLVEVCSGSNGAAQATTCTSDFTAGNTVTYYSLQGGPNSQGLGFVPFATSLSTVSLTITQPVYIVQNKYQITGQFAVNGTASSTGIGSGGSTGTALECKGSTQTCSSAGALGSFFSYSLTNINTYSTTTFPYEAGFVSSTESDVNSRSLNMALECALAKTGGVAGDAPTITGIPQVATSGGGVTNGGTTYFATVIPDSQTQKIAQNAQSPLTSTGVFSVTLSISQGAFVSSDAFTLTCTTYMWFSQALFVQANGSFGLNTEAVAVTPTFTLTMKF